MSILSELIKLNDPLSALLSEAEAPVELKAVIDAFPKHHEKALSKLWGGKRLVWHGMRFFDDGELGEAYTKAEEAAVDYINDGYETDVNLNVDGSQFVDPDDEDEYSGDIDVDWKAEFGDSNGGDRQECYLGYDPKKDVLYIGFDAWVSDDAFNDAWDDAFHNGTGQTYNGDGEQEELFSQVWKEYQDEGYGFWGLVFEIDRNFNCEEALPPMQGGFYKGSYRLFKQQHPNVVDLRLD